MPRETLTDITMLTDRSGSMRAIREGTIAGINKFVEDQAKEPGEVAWTFVLFDDPASAAGRGEFFPNILQPIATSKPPVLNEYNYVPAGDTALVDAVCLLIDATGQRFAAMRDEDRPSKVLFVIMTDGKENASKRFSRADMNVRIAHQQTKYNWQFVFLGANQDAVAEAQSYGIRQDAARTYQHTNQSVFETCGLVSAGTSKYREEKTSGAAFSFPADK